MAVHFFLSIPSNFFNCVFFFYFCFVGFCLSFSSFFSFDFFMIHFVFFQLLLSLLFFLCHFFFFNYYLVCLDLLISFFVGFLFGFFCFLDRFVSVSVFDLRFVPFSVIKVDGER